MVLELDVLELVELVLEVEVVEEVVVVEDEVVLLVLVEELVVEAVEEVPMKAIYLEGEKI